MARYDRIARIEPPPRSHAFPAWLVFRDLEGREREPELSRRARLRFLVLRCLQRAAGGGERRPEPDSVAQQVAAAQHRVADLPAGDREREALSRCLDRASALTPVAIADAALTGGAGCERNGHGHAAEEFHLTALQVAETHDLREQRLVALLSLGRVCGARGDPGRARTYLESAVALAEAERDLGVLGDALRELAVTLAGAGDPEGGRSVAAAAGGGIPKAYQDRVDGLRAAAVCALEVAAGRLEAGLQAGWRAVELLSFRDPLVSRVLLDVASAFRRLGLREAAESCYRAVTRSATREELRRAARIEYAVVAAEAGDPAAFRERRKTLLEAAASEDGHGAATIQIGLGRGAMLIDDLDDARSHLRLALAAARGAGLGDAVPVIEELLSDLERRADRALRVVVTPATDGARSIAARFASVGREQVASV
jgi:tetratricopeptide (TPR) repeat protein